MGVPTPEVGYTPAMPRREHHEVHKDMWWHWTKKNIQNKNLLLRRYKQFSAFNIWKGNVQGACLCLSTTYLLIDKTSEILLLLLTENGFIPGGSVLHCKTGQYNTVQYNTLHYTTITHNTHHTK